MAAWRLARGVLATYDAGDSLIAVAACALRGRPLPRPAPPGPAKLIVDVVAGAAPGVWDYLQRRLDGRGLRRHVAACMLATAGGALVVVLLGPLTACWAPVLQLITVTAAMELVKALTWQLVAVS